MVRWTAQENTIQSLIELSWWRQTNWVLVLSLFFCRLSKSDASDAKDKRKCWLFKSSTTHHTEENSMASPTQTVVRKGIPNLLIAEGLLKILRDLVPPSSPKSHINFFPRNGRTTKYMCPFLRWNEHRLVTLTVTSDKLFFLISNGVRQVNIIPLTIYSIFPPKSPYQFPPMEW